MHCVSSLLLFCALVWATPLLAGHEQILRTIDLNTDCVADTLYGRLYADKVVPTHIAWGRRQQASACDSLYYASLPPQLWQHRTEFTFEGFTVEHCAIRSVQVNGDSHRDMLLVVHGYREEQLAGSVVRRLLHHLLIAVPAQRGLDTLQAMAFRIDSGIVLSPFPHGYLRAGIEVGIVQRIPRSGVTVQQISPLRLPVNVRSDVHRKESILPRPVESQESLTIRAVPNPSQADAVTIECSRALAGAVIEVYSLHGELLLRRSTDPSSSAIATLRIETAGLAGGTYMVRVTGETAVSASTLLVVRR